MRKSILLLPLFLLAYIASYAQADIQRQIDKQVWKPFIRAFNNDDMAGFKAVHSKDVARVLQDDEVIQGYADYFKPIPDSIKTKWKSWKKNIELRFTQRIAGKDKAFEVGYYKTTSTNTVTGETRISYGKFHVLLQKEKGVWKILMDADAHEQTDESVFKTGTPIK